MSPSLQSALAALSAAPGVSRRRASTVRRLVLLALCWLAILLPASAQQRAADESLRTTATTRPRIGLVLSGGGARGGAHVGVLKVLEELRVPVDLIVGTSAGSIVGAAYATGMPLAQIEMEMLAQSTALLFRDTDRREVSLARKADDEVNYIGPELGLGPEGFSLPKGIVSGLSLEAVLRRLTARQRHRNFDHFPIPFRAVATDVATADMVVLGEGSLTLAIRASMALPAAVNPVEIDGRLLIDGGVVRNLPVDVARAMGADVIIAVNIGTPLLTRKEITSLLNVSDQMSRILTVTNVNQSLRELTPKDILITPDLREVDTGDFDNLAVALAAGERAAREAAAALEAHRLEPAQYEALIAVRSGISVASTAIVDEIRIEGADRVHRETVRAAMDTEAGKPLDVQTIERDIKRIYGRGDFEHVSYFLDAEPGSGQVMTVEVREKSWGPHYFRFGLGLSSDFEGNTFFALRATHRRTWLNDFGAEWRNDLQIGHADHLRTEFIQPLTPAQRLFVSAAAGIERTPFDIYNEGVRLASFRRQSSEVGLDLGLPLGTWGEIRAGVVRGEVKLLTDTSIVPGSLLIPDTDTGGYRARLRIDTLDNVRFPRSGVQLDASVYAARRQLGADQRYTKATITGRTAIARGPHSLQLAVEGADALSGELPDYELFSLGGFLQLSGYRTGEFLGTGMRFARLVYNYRISRPGLLDGAYVGLSAEIGRITNSIRSDERRSSVRGNALYVAVDTPLGPVYLAYGRGSTGAQAVYFYLGQP